MSRLAVFRADASVAIGGGHIRRCLVLAETLRAADWRCVFACRAESARTVPALAQAGHTLFEVDTTDGETPARIGAEIEGCDLLVVDHYGLDAAFERACRSWAGRILVLDDCADRDHDCDLLLDQNLGRAGADYAGRVPAACRPLLGPDYALLRAGFAEMRPAVLAARRFEGPIRRVLVTLGTADPDNVTAVVLAGLAAAGTGAAIDVVLGGAAPHLREINELVKSFDTSIEIHTEVEDMARLMARADFAIGAAGSTSWERCCLGLPGLVTVIADNQTGIADALETAGAARNLGRSTQLTPDAVATAFRAFDSDAAARATMSARAATVCDGLGANRMAEAVSIGHRPHEGRPLALRPAHPGDADILLAWQQAPETRRHMRNPAVPTAKEHAAWFRRKLDDPRCIFNILTLAGKPAGVVRLDWRNQAEGGEAQEYEVSVLVAPEMTGKGLGKAGLALVRRLVPHARLVAEVLPENVASHRLFMSAGYVAGNGMYASPPTREPEPARPLR